MTSNSTAWGRLLLERQCGTRKNSTYIVQAVELLPYKASINLVANPADTYYLSSGGWRSKMFLLRTLEKNMSPTSLISGGFLATLGFPWLVKASPQSLLSSARGSLPVCICVHISHFYKDTVILDQGPTLFQYDLILSNHICNSPVSK